MSLSDTRWVYKIKVGCPVSKHVLAYLAFNNTCSAEEISRSCEIPLFSIIETINWLKNNKFIEIREGNILQNDEKVYQFVVIKRN